MNKKFEVLPPICQAAMAGFSDRAFCQQMLDYGVGMVTLGGYSLDETSLTATYNVVKRGKKETIVPLEKEQFNQWCKKNLILNKKSEKQLIAVNGRIANTNNQTANILNILSRHVDCFELNAHCRQPEFLRINSGYKLLLDLEKLEEILDFVKNFFSSKLIGIKIRGYTVKNISQLFSVLESLDITYIHLDAMRKGIEQANLKLVQKICKHTSIPVIGNNSIRTINDINNMLKSGAIAVSLARPLLSKPYIIQELINSFEGKVNDSSNTDTL